MNTVEKIKTEIYGEGSFQLKTESEHRRDKKILLKGIEQLKNLVECAYKDGWFDGNNENCNGEIEQNWESS